MFNVGDAELLIILIVALVVLGPSKLPEAARQMGKAMSEFRRMSSGFQAELRDALDEPVSTAAPKAAGPGAEGPGPALGGAVPDDATAPDLVSPPGAGPEATATDEAR